MWGGRLRHVRGVTSDDLGRRRPRVADDLHRLRQPDGHQHLRAGGCSRRETEDVHLSKADEKRPSLGRTELIKQKIEQCGRAGVRARMSAKILELASGFSKPLRENAPNGEDGRLRQVPR